MPVDGIVAGVSLPSWLDRSLPVELALEQLEPSPDSGRDRRLAAALAVRDPLQRPLFPVMQLDRFSLGLRKSDQRLGDVYGPLPSFNNRLRTWRVVGQQSFEPQR